MKCALEFIAEKAIAEEKYQAEQERLDNLCRMAYSRIAENSITLCETVINKEFEKCARERRPLSVILDGAYSKDRLGNEVFYLLKEDKIRYADGRYSYSIDTSKGYDLQIIKDYLSQFCIKTNIFESSYMSYGCGCRSGVSLRAYISNLPCVE